MAIRDWKCDCGECPEDSLIGYQDWTGVVTYEISVKRGIPKLYWYMGNAVRLVAKAMQVKSRTKLKDLKKARGYLDRAIGWLEQEHG